MVNRTKVKVVKRSDRLFEKSLDPAAEEPPRRNAKDDLVKAVTKLGKGISGETIA